MEKYWLWLCSIPGLYCRQIRLLLAYFGTPRQVYEAPEAEFEIWRRKNIQWVDILLDYRRNYEAEEVWNRTKQKGMGFVSREHPLFPRRLKQLPDCPAGLFYKGALPEEQKVSAAIVGARRCSNYGRMMARELGSLLAAAGVQIISGLAYGVDGNAQEAAADAGGSSFGILGCGADRCYPRENFGIYQKILERGGILSELPAGTAPLRHHFPMRNRIISGLADAVIVVEARESSGSLLTADFALEQGKEVYAVPGRSKDVLSRGCNRLIEQGAGIVLSSEWLLEQLKLSSSDTKNAYNFLKNQQIVLASEEKWVYSNLDLLPESLEILSEKTDMPPAKLYTVLLRLELKGLAVETAKNQYAKLK